MATYADVTARIRALLDDVPNNWASDDFLVQQVNIAQGQLVTDFLNASVERLRFRAPLPIYLPAGQTVLSTGPTATVRGSNLLDLTDDFTQGGAPTTGIWGPPPLVFGPTVVTPGQVDPNNTSGATSLATALGSGYTTQRYGDHALPLNATGQYVTAAVWMKAPVPCTGSIVAGYGLSAQNFDASASKTFNLTMDWERYSVTFGPFTSPASGTRYPGIQISVAAAGGFDTIVVWHAKCELNQFDTGDVVTTGNPLDAVSFGLPSNLIQPDQLWEAPTTGLEQEFRAVEGPIQIPNTMQTSFLRWYDWYGGNLVFLGATQDKLLRLDYYGSLENFPSPSVGAQPILMAQATNALAFRAAANIYASRGQAESADRFNNMADKESAVLINIEVKAQQGEPLRRNPYFGYPRYPRFGYGYYGNY